MPAGGQQQVFLPDRDKDLIKIVEITKQGYNVQRGAPERKAWATTG
jgi:hypothetical protein